MEQSLEISNSSKKTSATNLAFAGLLLLVGGAWIYMRYIRQPEITLELGEPNFETKSVDFNLLLNGKSAVKGTAVLGVKSIGTQTNKYKLNIDTEGRKIVFTAYKNNGELALTKSADFQMKK